MEYYTVRKTKDQQFGILIWVTLTSIRLSARSRSQNNTFRIIPFIFAHMSYFTSESLKSYMKISSKFHIKLR